MAKVTLPVIDINGKSKGSVEAPELLFAAEPNEAVLHFVCEGQRYRYYKKTAKTKGRSEVSGGGKKSRQQKGSGSARQGGNRAPHFVGGGVVFGPQPVNREFKVNKKVRQIAMATVLSDRAGSGQIHVLDWAADAPKTASVQKLLETMQLDSARVGFVTSRKNEAFVVKSVRNLKKADVLTEEKWTPIDFVKADCLIFTKGAYDSFVKEHTEKAPAKGEN
jgi:large subunit ribosomal protein L4